MSGGRVKGITAVVCIMAAMVVIGIMPAADSLDVYTVWGRVTEDGIYPVSGAVVAVTYHGVEYTGTTDASGDYSVMCDPGTGPAVVSVTFKGNTASHTIDSPNLAKLNDKADLNVVSTPAIYEIWGQVYVNGEATDGATVSTTWGNGSTTTSRSEYGYTGLYQLFMTLPPTPGPATVTATYNGYTATAQIASPSINGTSGLVGTDRLDMIITYSTVTATPTPTPTPTPTVTPTATAAPTATVTPTSPVPSATVPAGNVSTNQTAPSITIAPSIPPIATPTAKPPMFQTGYGEQVLLVMAALGITAVLLRKKD